MLNKCWELLYLHAIFNFNEKDFSIIFWFDFP